jgi:hypothetical protein
MLMLLCLFAVAGVIGCGGGGSLSSNPPTNTPATTAGNYTFTVTGANSSSTKTVATADFTVTVK